MTDTRCPRCGESKIVGGIIAASDGNATGFIPSNSKLFRAVGGVPLASPQFACLGCGLAWTALSPSAIREFIRTQGEEIARQHLDELDHGPCRGLPDTEWGRMVGAKVAELDVLAMAGRSSLVRRYREMRGVTWDVAIREATHWRRLTREEKLALFGWVPKVQPEKDDLAEIL